MTTLTADLRARLVKAIEDEVWDEPDRAALLARLAKVENGTILLDDLTDVEGDGKSDVEQVSMAVDYFGL